MDSKHYEHTLLESLYSLIPQTTVWKDAPSSLLTGLASGSPEHPQQMHKVLVGERNGQALSTEDRKDPLKSGENRAETRSQYLTRVN